MKNGMTVQERYNDICKISGLSEEIVRRVLNAERESVINSLKRGENATLIGRCIMKPRIEESILVGGGSGKNIKVKAEVAQSLKSTLAEWAAFEGEADEEVDYGIRIRQIPDLE